MKEIRNIIAAYDAADRNTEQLALASIVKIEESSYRRIGARMLVSSNGNWVGGISGGCLEGDALRRTQKAISDKKVSKVTYDTMDDDANEIGVGLGCNGRIEVMFSPIDYEDMNNPIEKLKQLLEIDKPTLLLKVIGTDDKTYDCIGKSVVVLDDSEVAEFCNIEASVLSESMQETYLKRRPQVFSLPTKNEGKLDLLIEYVRPETKLVIVGDNYDVRSLIAVSVVLGWEITVVGNKKKLTKGVYQNVNQVVDYNQLNNIKMDSYTAVIFMTHDYNWDKKLLPIVLDTDVSYIGMLGPKKRMVKMELDLDMKLSNRAHFFSPTGLDIGAETPEEISISIVSEIISNMRKRHGGSLRERTGPIHERY